MNTQQNQSPSEFLLVCKKKWCWFIVKWLSGQAISVTVSFRFLSLINNGLTIFVCVIVLVVSKLWATLKCSVKFEREFCSLQNWIGQFKGLYWHIFRWASKSDLKESSWHPKSWLEQGIGSLQNIQITWQVNQSMTVVNNHTFLVLFLQSGF